ELFSKAFFPGDPLGLSIAGTPATVRSFGNELTLAYFEQNFHAGNLVLVAAGNIDHDCFVDLASTVMSSRFSGPPTTPAAQSLGHPALERREAKRGRLKAGLTTG